MRIEIKNCNNIDTGIIEIQENKLNIKYAINGTGKSTIAKALECSTIANKDLNELLPFKYKDEIEITQEHVPNVLGLNPNSNIAIFNEDYVEQFVYKQDEVIKDSFEIFIRTKDYDERMEQIEKLILDIKETFNKTDELQILINDLSELSSCFGKSKTGYSAAGSIGKGIGKGNKLENIPQNL